MSIWNLGSINADLFYDLPHFPEPGETLASDNHRRGLGGKGTNISVAAARAAGRVHHIGAIGADGLWAKERLLEYGVDVSHVSVADQATGHAIIATDRIGENQIILFGGANESLSGDQVAAALSDAFSGDWFVCQNETNQQTEGAALAKQLGQKVAYVAAPFDASAVESIRPYLDLLILNDIEAAQLEAALGVQPGALGIKDVVITRGAKGSVWLHDGHSTEVAPVPVTPVDTTGAGDTFAGYVIACLDRGQPMEQALKTASLAAAIMVTRRGTADVIPDLKDLEEFRANRT